jgi:hypothetical protein
MRKIILLITIITLFTNCSKDDDDNTTITINDIAKNVEMSFSIENYQPGLITFSGSVFSVIKNNNNVDFNVRSLKVYEVNGDVLYEKNYNNDFITVSKNGGEWLDGKNFNYALFPVIFEWTIVYKNETKIIQDTFEK